jgi:hypothetical protein
MTARDASRLTAVLLLTLMLAACGGGYGGAVVPTTGASDTVTGAASSTTVIALGDSPSDRIVSFEVTVNAVVLTDINGNNVTAIAAPVRVELTRLAGTFAPISAITVPQGTYTKATFALSDPEVEIVATDGSISKREPQLPSTSVTISFSPNLVVGANAVTLNFDFDVAKSVIIDASGSVTLAPTIVVSTGIANPAENRGEDGELEDVRGTVKSTASNSFMISVHDGVQTLTFRTDASTIFQGITVLADLKAGMQVDVNATVLTDGTLLAKKVEAEDEIENETNGMELEGLIASKTGSPVTQFSIVTRDVSSSTSSGPSLGTTINVTVDSNTKFEIQSGKIALTSLPFTPTFDANTLSSGQNVEVDSDGATRSPVRGRKVVLHEQSLTGIVTDVVANAGLTSFTLTVPSDSVFSRFSGSQTVTVYQQAATELKGLSTITNGNTLRVRGLVSLDGGTFKVVARRITTP